MPAQRMLTDNMSADQLVKVYISFPYSVPKVPNTKQGSSMNSVRLPDIESKTYGTAHKGGILSFGHECGLETCSTTPLNCSKESPDNTVNVELSSPAS